MMVVILLGAWAGIWLDKKVPLGFPVFTLIFIIVAVVIAIYWAVKDFLQK